MREVIIHISDKDAEWLEKNAKHMKEKKMIGLKSINSHVQMLRTVIKENGVTYTHEGMMVFLQVLLKDFEILLAEDQPIKYEPCQICVHFHQSGPFEKCNADSKCECKGRS